MAQLANLTTTLAIESSSFVNGIEQSRGAVRRLLQQLDPAAAAVVRYKSQLDLLEKTMKRDGDATGALQLGIDRLKKKLEEATASGGKLTQTNGMMRSGMQQLSFQLGDVAQGMAMGTKATTIFAQQSGQMIQALQLMTGETKGFLRFLSGSWGMAISSALVVLTPLVAKLFQGNDAQDAAVDKLKKDAEQSRITAEAKKAFATTVEGLRQAIDAQNEALKKSVLTEQDAADQANMDAKNRLEQLKIRREQIATELAYQQSILKTLEVTARGGGHQAETAQLRLPIAYGTVDALQTSLAETDASVTKAEEAVNRTRAALAELAAKRATDPIERINDRFKQMKADAIEAAVATGHVTAELTRQLATIDLRRKAALKAEEASNRASNDNRQTGRQISLPEAEAIVKSIGGVITSATRSFEKQAQLYNNYLAGKGPLAAKPGSSDHEFGRALDIAKTPGMSLAKIRQAFTEAGVSIKQLLDEGNHFHVAWATDAKAAAAASRDEAAAIKLIRDASTGAYKAIAGLALQQRKTLAEMFGDDADQWGEFLKKAETAFTATQHAQIEDERELQRIREDHLRSLSDLYYDLFDGGTKRIWQDFEREAFDVLAKLAAQWTMAGLFPAAGQSKGGFFSNLFSAIGQTFGGGGNLAAPGGTFNIPGLGDIPYLAPGFGAGLPGFAAGGSFQFGGRDGIDRNILSLNGSPIARVSKGETATIGRSAANDRAPIVFDLRGAVMTQDLLEQVNTHAMAGTATVLQDRDRIAGKKAGRRLGR